jgi:cytochrome c oxidase assembly protein subunit 15
VTGVALVALVFIVVTGAAVRLTGSGLGCSDWPACEHDQLVAPLELHPMVEFVNRVITGLVSAAVIAAVLASRWRRPRRRDLERLSWGLVAGVLAQIVLGGITVLFHLWPPLVMSHLVLSLALVAVATVLHHRAHLPDPPGVPTGEPARVGSGFRHRIGVGSRLLLAATAVAVVTGTVVTGAGPHGGDEDVARLPVAVPTVARIHGIAVVVLVALTLLVAWRLHRAGAPERVHQALNLLLVAEVAQAGVGYTQYFTDVPPLLVGVHVLGATVVWWAAVRLHLELRSGWAVGPDVDGGGAGSASADRALAHT